MKQYDRAVAVFYYMVTTISTVGFGDFYPQSDLERLLCALMMLVGVNIFSSMLSEILEMFDKIKSLNANFDEGPELQKFFSVIRLFFNLK